ncbi:MAG: Ig-like domain-containing protein, partial [Pirellulales bacterium]
RLLADGIEVASGTAAGPIELPTSPLEHGPHTLVASAEDQAGNKSGPSASLEVEIDTSPPLEPVFGLAPSSDSDPLGDLGTTFALVTLAGQTTPDTTVTLAETGVTTTSDGQGAFVFANVPLVVGVNLFTTIAVDRAGNRRTALRAILRGEELAGQDTTPPVVAAALANDTGGTDGLTLDPTILGTASDNREVALLRAGLDNTPAENFVDVTSLLQANQFTFTRVQLEQLAGGPLADGPHTLRLQAEDASGNLSQIMNLAFQLDTSGPTFTTSLAAVGSTTESFFDVFFTEGVTGAAFELSSYRLVVNVGPDAGQPVAIDSVEQIDATTARITLLEPLPSLDFLLTVSTAIADQAGNPLGVPNTFAFTLTEPVGITEISPFQGEPMVSVARDVVVRFEAEIDPATVNDESFYLIANGDRIDGNIRISSTRKFATFIPNAPLPPSTEVRVIVDGNLMTTSSGQPIDADGDDVRGGVGTVDFTTLPLTRLANTNLFGYVYDSFRRNSDGTNVPLVGATIRVDAFPEANAVTDENGRFELVDMPAPEFFVHIDGSTTTQLKIDGELVDIDRNEMTYPSVGKPLYSVPGQTVQVNKPSTAEQPQGVPFDIFLPSMNKADFQDLSLTEETEVGFGQGGKSALTEMFPAIDPAVWDRVGVSFAAGSAIDREGNPSQQAVIVPVPPDRIPAPLPDFMNPQLVISIQAGSATSFDVPVPVTFPNLEGLAPGERTLLLSYNHAAGRWDPAGSATVSDDGLTVVSDPGTGVAAPGWNVIQQGVIVRGNLVVGQRGGLFGRSATDELSPQTGRHFYSLENLDNGFTIRGTTDVADRIFDRQILAANTRYRLSVFGLTSGQYGSVEFETPGNGVQITAPIAVIGQQNLVDTDQDGLPDGAEQILGTAFD